MNPILRNVLAVIAGIIVGMVVNMGIIILSGELITYPEGINLTDAESLKANIHLFKPIHYLMPFLAHAIGTLAGAYTAARLAANNKLKFALLIGVFFLFGGIMNIQMLDSPMWFNIIDVFLAYIPMGWLGYKMMPKV